MQRTNKIFSDFPWYASHVNCVKFSLKLVIVCRPLHIIYLIVTRNICESDCPFLFPYRQDVTGGHSEKFQLEITSSQSLTVGSGAFWISLASLSQLWDPEPCLCDLNFWLKTKSEFELAIGRNSLRIIPSTVFLITPCTEWLLFFSQTSCGLKFCYILK